MRANDIKLMYNCFMKDYHFQGYREVHKCINSLTYDILKINSCID